MSALCPLLGARSGLESAEPVPAYRSPGGARGTAAVRRVDVDACICSVLAALGCAPTAVRALGQAEGVSTEATLCALVTVLALTSLLCEGAAWWGELVARRRSFPRASAARSPRPSP